MDIITLSLIPWLTLGPWALLPVDDVRHGPNADTAHQGVVVEQVGKGSATEASGIQPGDHLLRWELLPSPSEITAFNSGEFVSPFTWGWLVMEEIPSGKVRITVLRKGRILSIPLANAFHELTPRPNLSPERLEAYRLMRAPADLDSIREALAPFDRMSSQAKDCGARDDVSWISLRSSEGFEKIRRWEEARNALERSLWRACSPEAKAQLQVLLARFYARRGNVAEAAHLMNLAATSWKAKWGAGFGYVAILLLQADLSRLRDDFPGSEEYLNAAARLLESPTPKGLLMAQLLAMRGVLAHRRGDSHSAIDYYRQALAINQDLAPASHLVAGNLSSLAGINIERGEITGAQELLLRALKILELREPEGARVTSILNNLGSLAWQREDLEGAEKYFRRSWEIRAALGLENSAMVGVLRNLGILAITRGDSEAAFRYLQEGLVLAEKISPHGILAADMKCLIATILRRRDTLKAQNYFDECLAVYRFHSSQSGDFGSHLINAGVFARDRGDFVKALDYYDQAESILKKVNPRGPELANLLDQMGLIFKWRGDLELAENYHLRALQLRRENPVQTSRNKDSYLALGNLYLARGDSEVARSHYVQVVEIEKALEEKGVVKVDGLASLGVLESKAGRLTEGGALLRLALKKIENVELGTESATILNDLAENALQAGRPMEALEYLDKAYRILHDLAPDSLEEARCLRRLGRAHLMLGDSILAGRYFRRSVTALDRQIERVAVSSDTKAVFRATHKGIYLDAINFLIDERSVEEAFEVIEQYRARSFLDQLAQRDLEVDEAGAESLLAARRALINKYQDLQMRVLKGDLRQSEREPFRRDLKNTRREIDRNEEALLRNYPHPASLKAVRRMLFSEMQRELDDGLVVLSFSIGPERSFAFAVMAHEKPVVQELDVSDGAISREILLFRQLLLNETRTRGATAVGKARLSAEDLARSLFRKLVAPVSDIIARGKRLLILPDGPLHLLPWNSLILEAKASGPSPAARRDWLYMAEWRPISTALSTNVFVEIRRRRLTADEQPEAVPIVAFGDPVLPRPFDLRLGPSGILETRVRSLSRSGLTFEALPATRAEVEGIAALFRGATTYLGEEATEERAKAIPRQTRIVHFATHSILDESLPLDSSVVLSIPQQFGRARDNGLLQAWEIFEKVRIDADLVVLSACETALGKEMGGEGLIGLTRAFQYAGARTVMASLWKISDRTTAEFMVRFYKHLKEGMPKDEALRAVQMEFIRGPIKIKNEKGEEEEFDASAPYYWAAFQLYGDWQ